MKRIDIKILTIILLVISFTSITLAKDDMIYFKVDLSQSSMLVNTTYSDTPEYNISNSILTDIGYKTDLSKQSSLLFIYELNYQGPGLKGYSEEGFDSRNMDHLFVAKYIYKQSPQTELAFKTDFFYQFFRIGKTETWGDALYNFGKTGLGFSITYESSPKTTLFLGIDQHYLWFPNYNDLVREALYTLNDTTGEGANMNTDWLNQDFFQSSLRLSLDHKLSKNTFMSINNSILYRFYIDRRIDDASLTTNPEDNDRQYDFLNELALELGTFLSADWLLQLKYTFTFMKSNYFYLNIGDVDTSGPTPVFDAATNENYNSYHQHVFSVPITHFFSSRSALIFIPQIEYRKYIDRKPKDDTSTFINGEKQYNLALSGTLSWEFKKYENLTINPLYTFKWTNSNNKDLTAGYNYNVHFFGIRLVFEY